jgi:hypothetical protein
MLFIVGAIVVICLTMLVKRAGQPDSVKQRRYEMRLESKPLKWILIAIFVAMMFYGYHPHM